MDAPAPLLHGLILLHLQCRSDHRHPSVLGNTTGGAQAVEDWKKVLSAGNTLDPIGLTSLAGINITTDAPLLDTIAYIGEIIDEIERLTP